MTSWISVRPRAALRLHIARSLQIVSASSFLPSSARQFCPSSADGYIDVVPERTDENLERLAEALCGLAARNRTESDPDGLPFDCSTEFFRNLPPEAIVNMTTEAGDLDLSFCPSGTSGFPDLKRDAVDIEAADRLHIMVASLEDVIRSKEAAGGEKDLLVLPTLRELQQRLENRGASNSEPLVDPKGIHSS